MRLHNFLVDGTVLTSNLEMNGYRFACSGENVTFICKVEEARNLRWVAVPFINVSDSINFLARNDAGTSVIRGSFSALLTEVSRRNNLFANLTSTLSIEDVSNILRSSTIGIQCSDQENTETSNLTVEGKMSIGRFISSGLKLQLLTHILGM